MDQLNELCKDWLVAKADELAANKRRVEIEEKIVAITGKKDDGSETHALDHFKVTVKGVMYTKMDWDKWRDVAPQIPAELHPVKTKQELDDKGVKWLRHNRPELYKLLPIEMTPGKTGVEVKVTA